MNRGRSDSDDVLRTSYETILSDNAERSLFVSAASYFDPEGIILFQQESGKGLWGMMGCWRLQKNLTKWRSRDPVGEFSDYHDIWSFMSALLLFQYFSFLYSLFVISGSYLPRQNSHIVFEVKRWKQPEPVSKLTCFHIFYGRRWWISRCVSRVSYS